MRITNTEDRALDRLAADVAAVRFERGDDESRIVAENARAARAFPDAASLPSALHLPICPFAI